MTFYAKDWPIMQAQLPIGLYFSTSTLEICTNITMSMNRTLPEARDSMRIDAQAEKIQAQQAHCLRCWKYSKKILNIQLAWSII